MPSTRKLPSGRWQARYRDRDGKVKAIPGGETFSHKAAALKAAALAEDAAAARPRYGQDSITWGQWCAQWWPTRQVKPGTLKRTEGPRDRYLMPRWADVPLRDIRRQDVRAWAVDLGQTQQSAANVQRIVHLFSASLTAAVDAELIAGNPAARLRLPPARQAVEHYLTREQVAAVADELAPAPQLAFLFLVGTGLRFGEMAGLHWDRVDLDRGILHVVDTWDEKHAAMWPYPKGRRQRVVPIPAALVERLRAQSRTDVCGYPHHEGRCRSGLALTTERVAVWRVPKFRRYLIAACALAGVEHTRVHDLRHTFASWVVQAGVPLERVGRILGHEDVSTTRRYAHFAADQHADVLAAVGELPVPAQAAARAVQAV